MNKSLLSVIVVVLLLVVGVGVMYLRPNTSPTPAGSKDSGGSYSGTDATGKSPSSDTANGNTGASGGDSSATTGTPPATTPTPPTAATPPSSTGGTVSAVDQAALKKQMQAMDAAVNQYGSINSSVQGVDESTSL